MSQRSHVGRHRTAASYSPVAEISSIARAAVGPGARAGSVLVASGGLVASFALPAAGAPLSTGSRAADTTTATRVLPRAVTAAPAVTAPTAASPVATETVGVVGVEAVAKPKPKPKPPPAPEPVVEAAAPTVQPATSSQVTSRATQRDAAPLTNVPQSSSQVVNIARGLLGIPYLYGGTSPSTGFDCSGFSQYVFAQVGISLPRTAEQQRQAATPVSDPQPGDLVFFGAPAWHMGIYTGNGMMIDSPRAGKSTSERPIFSGVSGYGRF